MSAIFSGRCTVLHDDESAYLTKTFVLSASPYYYHFFTQVADRTVIETTDAERKAVQPAGLQEAIDTAVSRCNKARSFVRPSGTEDIVRIYAEAETLAEVEALCRKVAQITYDMCNGVGDRP